MDCLEVEKKIPIFLENHLEEKELRDFVEHIETCSECREELAIHFLASEGLAMIEEGESFDLDKELDDRLYGSLGQYETKTTIWARLWMLEGVAILIIIAIFLYAFL